MQSMDIKINAAAGETVLKVNDADAQQLLTVIIAVTWKPLS